MASKDSHYVIFCNSDITSLAKKQAISLISCQFSLDFDKLFGSFPFVPPCTICGPQLQSTRHYIVTHYVKIWHVRMGGANNMYAPTKLGGGAQTEKDPIFHKLALALII